jgi:uncharacterized protein YcfJ
MQVRNTWLRDKLLLLNKKMSNLTCTQNSNGTLNCSSQRPGILTRTAQGALVGTIIGAATGNVGRGALLGTGIGASAGILGFGGGQSKSRSRARSKSRSRSRSRSRSPVYRKSPVRGRNASPGIQRQNRKKHKHSYAIRRLGGGRSCSRK